VTDCSRRLQMSALPPRVRPWRAASARSGIQLDHVAIDKIAASVEAVAHLTDRGRRRIGAQARESAQTAHQRLAGYRRALDSAGLPYRPELVCSAPEWRRGRARPPPASCSACRTLARSGRRANDERDAHGLGGRNDNRVGA
jgi:hypothetical protein